MSDRLEPGEPWRQLEQQRQELPVSESQQEYADEPEQQPGLSGRRSSIPMRVFMEPAAKWEGTDKGRAPA